MNGKTAKALRKLGDREAQKLSIWQAKQKHRFWFWVWTRLGKWLIKPISPERRKFINRKIKKQYIENRRKWK